jgi:hypothetical protein
MHAAIGTRTNNVALSKQVSHHEEGQDEAGDEQRDTEDKPDRCALTDCQNNNQTGDKQQQPDRYTEGKPVCTVKGTSLFCRFGFLDIHPANPPLESVWFEETAPKSSVSLFPLLLFDAGSELYTSDRGWL